jgi:guanylate kinase
MTPKKLDRFAAVSGPPRPLLIVLSGLSGAGKDTLLEKLRHSGVPFYFSVSATTRAPRPGEKEGYDYHFVTREAFQKMIKTNELLEWANVYGNFYGRPKEPIRQALLEGKDVIVRIDVQGAATYKKLLPQAVLVFLCTLSLEELEKRLRKRRTESAADLELRLKTAEQEMEQIDLFDYVIVNRENEIEKTVADVKAIITAEKCRVSRPEIKL